MTSGTLIGTDDGPRERSAASRQESARNDPYRQYRSILLSPEEVKNFSALRPWKVVFDTMACWAVILGAWSLVLWKPAWWTVAIAIPVVGARFYALFIIGHDGLHGRLFNNRKWNNRFNDWFIMGAIGAITRLNNRNHLLHHLNLANHDDPDRHRHSCFNKTEPLSFLFFLAGFSSIFRSIGNVFFTNSRISRETNSQNAQNSYKFSEVVLLFGWQLALVTGHTMLIGWWAYPVLWLVPVYVGTFLGDNLRSFAEHSQPESDEEADTHRLITFRSNPIERWFLSPMNMNFHTVHHLWMSIPYYNLPAADQMVRRSPHRTHLEWRGSYTSYLLRYFRELPLIRCRREERTA